MPTKKQKKAFDISMENNGNVSKAMREAGYSPNTAKTPKALTESDGWKELIEEYMPDELLAKKNLELLNNKRSWQAVNAGLDKAYKVKGRYIDKVEHEHRLSFTQRIKQNKLDE